MIQRLLCDPRTLCRDPHEDAHVLIQPDSRPLQAAGGVDPNRSRGHRRSVEPDRPKDPADAGEIALPAGSSGARSATQAPGRTVDVVETPSEPRRTRRQRRVPPVIDDLIATG